MVKKDNSSDWTESMYHREDSHSSHYTAKRREHLINHVNI